MKRRTDNDGYPDYLVRVDHTRMRILVNAECINVPVGVEIDDTDEDYNFAVFPAKFEVCENCQGKGSHVNRSIDGNGLSQSDFDEDPEFARAYWAGAYDVLCDVCHGNRVVLGAATDEGCIAIEQAMDDYYASKAEVEAERRMGA